MGLELIFHDLGVNCRVRFLIFQSEGFSVQVPLGVKYFRFSLLPLSLSKDCNAPEQSNYRLHQTYKGMLRNREPGGNAVRPIANKKGAPVVSKVGCAPRAIAGIKITDRPLIRYRVVPPKGRNTKDAPRLITGLSRCASSNQPHTWGNVELRAHRRGPPGNGYRPVATAVSLTISDCPGLMFKNSASGSGLARNLNDSD